MVPWGANDSEISLKKSNDSDEILIFKSATGATGDISISEFKFKKEDAPPSEEEKKDEEKKEEAEESQAEKSAKTSVKKEGEETKEEEKNQTRKEPTTSSIELSSFTHVPSLTTDQNPPKQEKRTESIHS